MRYVRPSCVLRVAQVRARLAVVASLVTLMAGAAGRAESQQVVTQAERVITVSRGASALMVNPVPIARFSVGEPDVAEVTIVSPTEVIINGKGLGTTTLFVWDNQGQVRVYSVEITADAPGLERFLRALMPDEEIQVTASRNAVTLSGNVKDPNSVSRAVQMAQTTGATVTPEELTAFCTGRISTYKIPRYWKITDAFPMTVTGKIQKFRMREIAIEELGLGGAAAIRTA